MDRRTLLKTGGMAALGLGFGGCALRAGRTEVLRPYVTISGVVKPAPRPWRIGWNTPSTLQLPATPVPIISERT